MKYYPLNITVKSAENLKDANLISKMKVYVVVSIGDDPNTERKTRVDKDGGTSPKWNDHLISFVVEAAAVDQNPDLPIVFRLRSAHQILGDKDVGVATARLKDLLSPDAFQVSFRCPVCTSPGKTKGTLTFSYQRGEPVIRPAPAKVKK